VEIKKDTIIRSKFHKGKSRTAWLGKVKEIVVHGTGGAGTLNWVRSGGRAREYYKAVALFHYLIQRDGTIWEIIDPDRWVYHSCRGSKDKNAIGIEMVNTAYDNSDEYTEEQYESLNWLMFEYLMNRYPDIKVIMSHKRAWQKNSRGRRWKECPGPGFDWRKIEDYMKFHNIKYQHDDRYESYWGLEK